VGNDGGEGARYRAFISYSHVDQAFGRRLHRRLERYGLPRRLVGRETTRGPVPRRVAPVFRDREEFSAAGDLTAEVRAALAASGALIVVCSPAAAASPWVAREVALFRELHPDRPVLAAIAAGEPAKCFPAPLTLAGGAPVEPLAADFRPHADGPRLGLLKLVAGVVGVGLDELVQRDAQRRLANVTAITAGAVAVALAMTALTTFALLAQREAQRQRGQAEALVEFMLTDLRDRLKGVGRLDVLTSVNQRALDYYSDQEIEELPPASLERRARVLHAMGEDDADRGNLTAAARELEEAERATAALLRRSPEDPSRLWAHAQSRYWTGYVNFRAGREGAATAAWLDYRTLSERLAELDPSKAQYIREVGYAEGNLCTIALSCPRDVLAALRSCRSALRWIEAAAAKTSPPGGLERDLANRHAWLSQAHSAAGDYAAALREREVEQAMLDPLIQADPRAMDLRGQWVAMQRAMAGLDSVLGRPEAARDRLLRTLAVVDEMIAFEPANQRWRTLKSRIHVTLNRISENRQHEGLNPCQPQK